MPDGSSHVHNITDQGPPTAMVTTARSARAPQVAIDTRKTTNFTLAVNTAATKKKQKSSIRSTVVQPHHRFGFEHIEFQPIVLEKDETTISTARMKAYFLDWMYNYVTEAQDFSSRYVWAQCVYRQQEVATAALPPINPLTIGICSTILEHLWPCFGKFECILRILTTELFNALYADYHVVNQVPPTPFTVPQGGLVLGLCHQGSL